MMGYPGFGGYWAPPYDMPMMPPPQSDSAPSTRQTNSVEPSSDPPDAAAASIYSLVEIFMDSLALRHPQCNLDGIRMFFTSNDYFHIDKVLGLTQDEIMKLGFRITVAKARFILNQVDDEMRCVEHEVVARGERSMCALSSLSSIHYLLPFT
jgi:hypothetical protein